MSASIPDAIYLRKMILEKIPANLFDNDPKPFYQPADLKKSLDPQRPLVAGDRGTGKTFLWSALSRSPQGAALLDELFGGTHTVRAAFGALDMGGFQRPGQDTIQELFRNHPPRLVWKTFLLCATVEPPIPGETWGERLAWVRDNTERSDLLLIEKDRQLQEEKRKHLVLFDAVDRDPPTWETLVDWHRALLQLLLDMQRFRALRVKAFLRRDILDATEVSAFPDASKILSLGVSFQWRQKDLYALLWRYLGTDVPFRQLASPRWKDPRSVPQELREEETPQKKLWHLLAGPYMGKTAQQGDSYRWLFNHLADAGNQVSPRSFLAAVRAAAEATPPASPTAISPAGVQAGVKQAAAIRAREIKEDFPWLDQVLRVLQNAVVPCPRSVVLEAWQKENIEEKIDTTGGRRRRSHGKPLEALLDELISLHVIQRLHDDRINIPDVFRLGFGLRRKGGVRP